MDEMDHCDSISENLGKAWGIMEAFRDYFNREGEKGCKFAHVQRSIVRAAELASVAALQSETMPQQVRDAVRSAAALLEVMVPFTPFTTLTGEIEQHMSDDVLGFTSWAATDDLERAKQLVDDHAMAC